MLLDIPSMIKVQSSQYQMRPVHDSCLRSIIIQSQCLSPSRRIRIKIRLLCQTRHSRPVSRLRALIIPRGIMHRNTIIPTISQINPNSHTSRHPRRWRGSLPKSTRPRRPLKPHLNINILFINMVQIIQNHIALRLIQAYNLLCHSSVHEQTLPSSSRMHSDDWMDPSNVLWTGFGIVTVQIGVC
jgi:hypothetical protein